MSWVAPRSSDDASHLTRRSYYLRKATNSATLPLSYTLNDQLPSGGIYRVSGTLAVGNGAQNVTQGWLMEVRLYGAFTKASVSDPDPLFATGDYNYIILGTIQRAGANTGPCWVWNPAPPLVCRAMTGSVWVLKFVNVITNAIISNNSIGAFSLIVDVRGGGDLEYEDL